VKRASVVCEPFTLDRAQRFALADAVADTLAARIQREIDEATASAFRAHDAEIQAEFEAMEVR
jgi:hypothetical protein